MSDCEAWWEGLRVDSRYRGQGLVGILRPHLERYLQEAGILISRNCVSSENTIMNGIMTRRGRQKVGCYASYKADPIHSSVTKLVQLRSDDFDLAWTLVSSSNFFGQERCLYISRGAKWQELTTQQLSDRLEAGLVWGLKQSNLLVAIAIQSSLEGSNQTLWIGFVNGTATSLPTLLYELRLLAEYQDYLAVGGIFPLCKNIVEYLNRAGYQRYYNEDYWVYEWQIDYQQ
ncbi:MAG TPA: hypothetical protein DCL61_23380 [Cyanobacteria bacterium UBA12227]|nr:hypothetical protein [Cyanobacteria bacterium UBA12227]